MTETTALDDAHAAMQSDPEDATLRLRFFERLADGELFLLLEAEADGDQITPRSFDLSDGPVVLAFDREDRLSQFTGGPAPYAAVSGRVLAKMLAGQGIGLGLNLEVAPSSILLPPEALDWLRAVLSETPAIVQAHLSDVSPPRGLPDVLLSALDTKLALMSGLASGAYLAAVTYEDQSRGHLLAFVDALPDAQPALAAAVGEALTFSGIEAGALDVGFLAASDQAVAALAKIGLRFDLPVADAAERPHIAPGRDPAKPPVLR